MKKKKKKYEHADTTAPTHRSVNCNQSTVVVSCGGGSGYETRVPPHASQPVNVFPVD